MVVATALDYFTRCLIRRYSQWIGVFASSRFINLNFIAEAAIIVISFPQASIQFWVFLWVPFPRLYTLLLIKIRRAK